MTTPVNRALIVIVYAIFLSFLHALWKTLREKAMGEFRLYEAFSMTSDSNHCNGN